MGGLGNQLFQIATGHSFSKKHNTAFIIHPDHIHKNEHSNVNYFNNVFKYWKDSIYEYNINIRINEYNMHPINIANELFNHNIYLDGYFQNYNYIDNDFISLLQWDTAIINKYNELNNSAFIHIRGGDYLNADKNGLYNVDITQYYKNTLEKIKDSVHHYYIFTNDKAYMESFDCFNDIRVTIVNENELDSLYLMSQCKKGGIAANSSFSWWGLYLDKTRHHLYLPNKWYNSAELYTDGYYFKEATIINTYI
jgi:hypothetical protein